jgi:hypothetical protein
VDDDLGVGGHILQQLALVLAELGEAGPAALGTGGGRLMADHLAASTTDE